VAKNASTFEYLGIPTYTILMKFRACAWLAFAKATHGFEEGSAAGSSLLTNWILPVVAETVCELALDVAAVRRSNRQPRFFQK